MNIRLSRTNDLQAIMSIIAYAQRYLASLHIDQWQDGYPTEAQFLKDMQHQESYVVLDDDQKVMATYMFSTRKEPTYDQIEGQWLTSATTTYGVIHRIAVAEHAINKGIAKQILGHCEKELQSQNITAMRIDTHADNKGMQHILKKLGYTYCGIITLTSGALRLAYEKLIA